MDNQIGVQIFTLGLVSCNYVVSRVFIWALGWFTGSFIEIYKSLVCSEVS